MILPITGISQSIELVTLVVAYLFVRRHLRQASAPVLTAVTDNLQKYLLFFAIFNFFLAIPHVVLFFEPGAFSPLMAWCYSIAHVFVFISLAYLSRMAIKIVPNLAKYEPAVIGVWAVITIVLTVLNVVFVTIQHPPYYDMTSGLTRFDIPSFIGILFGNISFLGYLPLVGLLLFSAAKNNGIKRRRALLIAVGMFITMIGGPLHAIAQDFWQVYILADILNIIGLALVALGVILQTNQSLSLDKPPQSPGAPSLHP